MISPSTVLKTKLRRVKNYDWVLLDCPPTLNTLTYNAFGAANYALGVVNCEDFALQGLTIFFDEVNKARDAINADLSLVGVLINLYQSNLIEQQRVIAELEAQIPNDLFKTKIARRTINDSQPEYATPLPEVSFPAITSDTRETSEIKTMLLSSGLSESLSRELAVFVTSKNRDVEYVRRMIQASQVPGIHNPPGYVRYMLLNNAEPMSVKESKPVKESRERKNQTKPTHTIDFSKYTTGGKYAYLTRARDTEAPMMGEDRGQFVSETNGYAPRL